jgi:hypothetical protein
VLPPGKDAPVPTLTRLVVGGDAWGWQRAGFRVVDGEIRLDGVTLEVRPDADRPVAAWAVTGVAEPVDGLPACPPRPAAPPEEHPNGVTRLDHVVVLTRDLDATTAAFVRHGVAPRGRRDVPGSDPPRRQVFFLLDTAVCEVVGPVEGGGATGSARFYGLAFVAPDLDDTVDALGLLSGPIRPAVQPGRRIATLRHRSAGIPVPTVLLSPR